MFTHPLKQRRWFANKTLYEVLGVGRSASNDQIKKAFTQKAPLFHPDRNQSPEAKEKFQELFEAYRVLRDDKARKTYDASIQTPYTSQRPASSSTRDDRQSTNQTRQPPRWTAQDYSYDTPTRVVRINPILLLMGIMLIANYMHMAREREIIRELQSAKDLASLPRVIHGRGGPHVLAFFNPYSGAWERLPEGCEPPPVIELLEATVPEKNRSKYKKFPTSLMVSYVPEGVVREPHAVVEVKTASRR